MRCFSLCLLSVSFYWPSPASAIDLTQVPRTINKEPAYQGQPKYALLVFGPEATTRVWLVHDGDTLYADLNGNGDLTEPSERFAANESSNPDDGTYRFELGEVQEGDRRHQSLAVYTMNLQHLIHSNSRIKAALANDPKTRFYGLRVELDMPGYRGLGKDGRVAHLVLTRDANGPLLFAQTPEEAPLIHFRGPWQVTLDDELVLTSGRQKHVTLGIGTPGLGPGTTAFAAYGNLVPEGLFPKLDVTFPGESKQSKEYVLRKRCCTVNFHDDVDVPAHLTVGEATVNVSFDEWLGGFVSPTTHQVKVIEPNVHLSLEPVSDRLIKSLSHPSRTGFVPKIQFSPDGNQLIAGDDTGGIVQLWDVASGDTLSTVNSGEGPRNTWNYFNVSTDWDRLYVVQSQPKRTQVLKEGEIYFRSEFNGVVNEWEIASGKLLRSLMHSPPRHIISMKCSPDERFLITSDELGGEHQGQPPRRTSIWNVKSGKSADLHADESGSPLFTHDSCRVAITVGSSPIGYTDEIKIFDTSNGELLQTIPVEQEFSFVEPIGWADDNATLLTIDMVLPKDQDFNNREYQLTFWDVATGKADTQVKPDDDKLSLRGGTFSLDQQVFAIPSFPGKTGQLSLVDISTRTIRAPIEFPGDNGVWLPAFSPDGQLMAVSTQVLPENPGEAYIAEDLPQPRIHLIDVQTGNIRETIIAPQAIAIAVAFSPDGKILASSGEGSVLLWDVSDLAETTR